MPIFNFKCPVCESVKEDVILKVTATSENYPTCECGQKMEKQWAAANGIFKGSGFHRTDYNAPTRGY